MSALPTPARLVEFLAVLEARPLPAPGPGSSYSTGEPISSKNAYRVTVIKKVPSEAVYKQVEHFCFPDLDELRYSATCASALLLLLSRAPQSELALIASHLIASLYCLFFVPFVSHTAVQGIGVCFRADGRGESAAVWTVSACVARGRVVSRLPRAHLLAPPSRLAPLALTHLCVSGPSSMRCSAFCSVWRSLCARTATRCSTHSLRASLRSRSRRVSSRCLRLLTASHRCASLRSRPTRSARCASCPCAPVPVLTHGLQPSLRYLLEALGTEALQQLLSALLTERRILFHARDLARLSFAVLGALHLLHPFQWQVRSSRPLPRPRSPHSSSSSCPSSPGRSSPTAARPCLLFSVFTPAT